MKKTKRKSNKNLLLCVGGLALLIVVAFTGPGMLLRIQDEKRLTQSVGTSNAGTDYTIWQENYEINTAQRLQNLAEGLASGKQYYLSKQKIEESGEVQAADIVDKYVMSADWNYILQDIGLLPEDYIYKKGLLNTSVWRYILYDEKLTDGVAIMAYDIQMQIDNEADGSVSMEFITDSETGTLYAFKIILEDETEKLTWEDMSLDSYTLNDFMTSYWQSYYTYETDMETYIEIPGNTNVQVEDNADNGYSVQLTYGTEHLQFQLALLNAAEGQLDRGVGIVMGIREIEDLIPDFLPEND